MHAHFRRGYYHQFGVHEIWSGTLTGIRSFCTAALYASLVLAVSGCSIDQAMMAARFAVVSPLTSSSAPGPGSGPAFSQELRYGPCPSGESVGTCLFGPGAGETPIWLTDKGLYPGGVSGYLGRHFDGKLDAAYVYATYPAGHSCLENSYPPTIIIIANLKSRKAVAQMDSPHCENVYSQFFGIIRGPGNLKYPFLAPGGVRYKAGSPSQFSYGGGAYRLCLFTPRLVSSPADPLCDKGFRPVSIPETVDGIDYSPLIRWRHGGGWVADVDGDGWDDIHLPHQGYIISLSGQDGRVLAATEVNPAPGAEQRGVTSPGGDFHAGRLYGSFTQFVDPATKEQRTLISAANAVGTFSDAVCNTSKYLTVLHWNAGQASVLWTDYIAWPLTAFLPDPWSLDHYMRKGDDINRCVHRYSDSLEWAGRSALTFLNMFRRQFIGSTCELEWFQLMQTQSSADRSTYFACFHANYPSALGTWDIHAYDLSAGAELYSMRNSYVWGRVDHFAPGIGRVLVIEQLGSSPLRFDRQGYVSHSFVIEEIRPDKTLKPIGRFTTQGQHPKLRDRFNYYGLDSPDLGSSWGGIPDLVVKDINQDGYLDFQLSDSGWISHASVLPLNHVGQ